ncbi:AhpC/TSA antioxidant enzyme-domain-containing protein, partial [Phyllosticta citribraziliensis]
EFQGDVAVSQDLPSQKDVDRCADMLVLGADGESRPFKSLYSGEGVATRQLIIFVRHFFCGNCQEFLRTLCASITPDALLQLGTPTFITVVGCGRPELIPAYAQTTGCPFPIFADPTTRLYAQLGMQRSLSLGHKKPDYLNRTSVVQTTVAGIYQSIKSGRGALQGGDIRQIGGEVLFEDEQVTWIHRMKNTRDHSEIQELRRVLGL